MFHTTMGNLSVTASDKKPSIETLFKQCVELLPFLYLSNVPCPQIERIL